MLEQIIENWRLCAGSIAAGLAQEVFAFARPIVYMVMVDRIVTTITPASIVILSVLLVAIGVLEAVFGLISDNARLRLNGVVGLAIASRIWPAIADAPPAILRRWRAGQVLERFGGVNAIYATYVNTAYSLAVTLPFALAVLAFVLNVSVVMTLIALASLPFTAGLGWFFARLRTPRLARSYDQVGLFNSTAIETVANIELVQSFGAQRFVVRKLWEPFKGAVDTAFSLGSLGAVQGRIASSMRNVTQAVLLACGAYFVLSGRVTIGQLVAFDLMAAQLQGRMGALSGIWSALQTSKLAGDRLDELTSVLPMDWGDPGARSSTAGVQGIAVSDASYSYGEGIAPVLVGADLAVRRGESVAIVGESGQGKSTLAKLMSGLLPVSDGCLLVDGVRVSDGRSLRGSVLYLPQEPAIFAGTIAENVALSITDGADTAMLARVESALAAVDLTGVVDARGGPLSLVGEGGRDLSGGQRQRLHVARVFMREPSFLILDEPTASLDEEASVAVVRAILARFDECGVVVITHSSALARLCQRTCRVEAGRVVGGIGLVQAA